MKKGLLKTILLSVALSSMFGAACFAVGWVNDGGDNWMYVDKDGVYATDTIKSSGNNKYYLDGNGNMVRDYLLEDYNSAIYYFDDSGKMVTNTWVAVEPSQVYNHMDNSPTIYLYYFGSNGKAYQATNGIVRKTIDGKKYLFNENGQMLSGWINEEGETFNEYESDTDPFNGYCYYAGDETDGVLREGWVAYEDGSVEDRYYMKQTLWFYFRSSDNKKVMSDQGGELKRKTINGKTYGFDDQGVMAMGWDSEVLDPNNEDANVRTKNYFFEDGMDVGRLAKKEWYYAVPSQKQNLDDHDQEIERWFYSLGGGDVVKEQMKKINSDYYCFDAHGIMRSGLCILDKNTKKYVDTIDAERTDGKDFIISRHYISVDNSRNNQSGVGPSSEFNMFKSDSQVIYYFHDDETDKSTYGKRKIGDGTIAFGDDDYVFVSRTTGENEGLRKKKYYQSGIRLKVDPAVGMGIVLLGFSHNEQGSTVDEELNYQNSPHAWAQVDKNHNNIKSDYIVIRDTQALWNSYNVVPVYAVISSSGTRISKSYTVKKDSSKRYWAIGNDETLMNIYEVPVRYRKGNGWEFQSDFRDTKGNVKKGWRLFGTVDEYGKTCRASKVNPGEYGLYIDETYCANFRFAD